MVARPLQTGGPTIDLYLGYNRANESTVLKRLLAKVDDLIERVSTSTTLFQKP